MHRLIDQVELITHRRDVPIANRLDIILEMGADALDMNMGFVSQVQGDVYIINRHLSDRYINGQRYPLLNTYASIALTCNNIVTIDHMKESEHRFHRAYRTHRWEAYAGVPLIVLNRVFGVLEFAHQLPHTFTEEQVNSVYVLGAAAAELIEQDVRAQASLRATQLAQSVSDEDRAQTL